LANIRSITPRTMRVMGVFWTNLSNIVSGINFFLAYPIPSLRKCSSEYTIQTNLLTGLPDQTQHTP
ncbi:hypothetical protein QUB52_20365, partial [Microcoleus sp. A6-C6]|uniref:hypothetical protein n=1 Tax=unclassified Microcoleus TaxID=2642155 RepID=UPI002FCF596B